MNFLLKPVKHDVPWKCKGRLDLTECTRSTKQLSGLSFTRFDTVTGNKSK